MSDRLEVLERDHRELDNKVGGISRIVAELTSWKRDVCPIRKADVDTLQREVQVVQKAQERINRKLDSKWPSLIASMIGGAIILVPLVAFIVTIILPAIHSLEAVAATLGAVQ